MTKYALEQRDTQHRVFFDDVDLALIDLLERGLTLAEAVVTKGIAEVGVDGANVCLQAILELAEAQEAVIRNVEVEGE